jgi:hypothetical protein
MTIDSQPTWVLSQFSSQLKTLPVSLNRGLALRP